jgi:hypothetical protein
MIECLKIVKRNKKQGKGEPFYTPYKVPNQSILYQFSVQGIKLAGLSNNNRGHESQVNLGPSIGGNTLKKNCKAIPDLPK